MTSQFIPDPNFLRLSSWISVMVFNFWLIEWTALPILFLKFIGISESKLDEPVLEPEIPIDDYKNLWCDTNNHGGSVACYIRSDLIYNILSVFPREIESVFFEILLPNYKPVIVGTIYRPPKQSNFLEVLNESMNKIDSISNEIYILVDFNTTLSLNDSYIFSNILNNKSVPSDVKSYYEFRTFF